MLRTLLTLVAVVLLSLLVVRLLDDDPPPQPPRENAQRAGVDAAPANAGIGAPETADATTEPQPTRTAATVDAAPFVVRGVVVADPRHPDLAGAQVLAYAGQADDENGFMRAALGASGAGHQPSFLLTGDPIATAPVDADGRFELRADARHLRLAIDHDLYLLPMPEIVHVPAATRHTDIVLSPLLGGMLRGRLLGNDVAAVTDIRLTLEPDPMSVLRDSRALLGAVLAAAKPTTRPLTDHTFAFRAVAPVAHLTLAATGERVCGRRSEAALQPGEIRDVVLPVHPAAELAVEVVDERGDPVPRAQVRARPAAATGMAATMGTLRERTAGDGTCVFDGLESTSYFVDAVATGFTADERTVDVAVRDEPVRVRLTLGDGGAVTGVVHTPDGQPLANARVAHHPSENIPLLGDLAAQLGPSYMATVARDGVETDGDGRFRLTGISDPGEFLIVGAHDDYIAGVAREVRIGDEDVVVVMQPHGGIAGNVVAVDTGEPVAVFQVAVVRTSFLVMSTPVAQQVVQDDGGAFRFDKVAFDSYTIEVQADGYARLEKSIRLTEPGVLDLGTLELERAAGIRGIVRDENGVPIANALVRKRRGAMADNPMLAMFNGSDARTYSDREGRFTLFPLAAGRLQLLATADGFASGRSERVRVDAGQQLEDVVITLDHGGSIAGRLACGTAQRPADFMVLAQHQITQNTATADLGPDGSFRIDNLDPGAYQVQAMPHAIMTGFDGRDVRPGEGLDIGELLRQVTDNVVSERCTVRSGEVAEVALEVEDLAIGAQWHVQVEIGGKPLADGFVEATSVEQGTLRVAMMIDGVATFGRMHGGQHRLQVRSGLTMTPVGEPTTLEYPAGASEHRSTLRLPGGELRGRVVDDQSDEPLRAAIVRLHHDGHAERDDPVGLCLTDADGRFSFAGLADGTYSIVAGDALLAHRKSTASRRSGIRVAAGGPSEELELRSRPAAGASVLVTTAAGRPIVGATVMCVDPEGRPVGSLGIAATGADGRAWFGGMAGGPARVVGRAPGFAPSASTVQTLSTDASTAFDLVLETGAPVRLSVVDRKGRNLRGAIVSARVDDGPWLPATLLVESIAADGSLNLGRLGAGDWQVRVTHPAIGTVVDHRAIRGTSPLSIIIGN